MSPEEMKTASDVQPTAPAKKKLSALQAFALGVGVVILLVLVVGISLLFQAIKRTSEHPYVLAAARAFNVSVASVNGAKIPYGEYIDDRRVLKKFYTAEAQGQVPLTDDDISDQALSRLVVNALLHQVSDRYHVTVQNEDLEAAKTQILAGYGGEDEAKKIIETQYGWNMDTFTEKIVKPAVLEQKLAEAFTSSTDEDSAKYLIEQVHARHILFPVNDPKDDAKIKKQAEAVLKRIQKGEDFAKLAGEFGTDATKDRGGDLGWFGHGIMVPEFEAAAYALDAGKLSPTLIKSQFGYHILKVDEKRLVRDFNAFMTDQFTNADIKVLLPIHNPFIEAKQKMSASASGSSTAIDASQ